MVSGLWTALPNIYGWTDKAIAGSLEAILTSGVDGLFVLGTTGQGTDFTVKERQNILGKLRALVGDPQRLIVAVSANSADDVREMVQHAYSVGVRGVAITPPFYGRFGDGEIERWVGRIFTDGPKKAEVYLYNMPSIGHSVWSPLLASAIDQLVGVDGIKDSSGEIDQLLGYINWVEGKHASVMVGDERLATYSFLMGGHGVVSGLSAAYPNLMVDLVGSCIQRDWEKARLLQHQVNQQLRKLDGLTPHAAVKALVDAMVENGVACK